MFFRKMSQSSLKTASIHHAHLYHRVTITYLQHHCICHKTSHSKNNYFERICTLGCAICVKMLKVQDPQWYSHCLTLFDDGITKILKKNWCWRVEHQGFVLCICRIKRTYHKNKFWLENHSCNASWTWTFYIFH